METFIIDSTDNDTTEKKIKDFLKEQNIEYKTKHKKKKKDRPYDPAFVKMILERAENAKNGNTIPYDDNLRKELFGK